MSTQPPPLEAIEALDAAYARFNAVRSLRRRDPELSVERVGGMHVLYDPSRPNDETYNRVLGLSEARLEGLDEALAGYVLSEAQLDVASDRMNLKVCGALRERGFAPSQTMVWLWAEPGQMAAGASPGVEVERFEGDGNRLIDLIEQSDDEPIGDEVRAKRARYYCTDTFRAYVAHVHGKPAGWATLWVHGGVGLFGNAFVFPAHRNRGAHGALHGARARDAAALGLRWVVTDVLPESGSLRNALRAGMQRRTSYVWWRR